MIFHKFIHRFHSEIKITICLSLILSTKTLFLLLQTTEKLRVDLILNIFGSILLHANPCFSTGISEILNFALRFIGTTGFESFFLRPNRCFRSNLLYAFCFKTFLLHVLIKRYPDIHFKGWIEESSHIIKRFLVCFSCFMQFENGFRSNLLYVLASSVRDYSMFKYKQIRFTICLAVRNIIII